MCFIVPLAETQSLLLEQIIHHFPLSFQEQNILKRGRNSASGRKTYPKRLTYSSSSKITIAPKNIDMNQNDTTTVTSKNTDPIGGVSIYQDATAFEALLGYLYMTNIDRCHELLQFVDHELHRRNI